MLLLVVMTCCHRLLRLMHNSITNTRGSRGVCRSVDVTFSEWKISAVKVVQMSFVCSVGGGTYPAFLPVVVHQRHQAAISRYLPHVSVGTRSCWMAPGPTQPCMAMARWERDDKQCTGSYAAMFRTMSVSVKFRAVIGRSSPS